MDTVTTVLMMSSNCTKLAATAMNRNIWISSDSGLTWTERETWNEGESVPSVQNWRKITLSIDGTKLTEDCPLDIHMKERHRAYRKFLRDFPQTYDLEIDENAEAVDIHKLPETLEEFALEPKV